MVLLTIAVVAGVTAVATGMVSGGLAEPAASIPARALPDHPPTGQDVAELRFVQAFRGYRMDQVDAAMDGLGAELERLRGLLAERGEPAARTESTGSTEPAEQAGVAGFEPAERD